MELASGAPGPGLGVGFMAVTFACSPLPPKPTDFVVISFILDIENLCLFFFLINIF